MADKPSKRSRLGCLLAMMVVVWTPGCGGGDDGGSPAPPRDLPLLVLGAFPGEVAPLLGETAVDEMVQINGRTFYLGVLGNHPVILGPSGIGLLNAAVTTRAALDAYDVEGVVVSAVAGTALKVGDVAVPTTWQLPDGRVYPTDAAWRELAEDVVASGAVTMDRCTSVDPSVSPEPVCIAGPPVVGFEGYGRSEDPFGDTAVPCQEDLEQYADVFGCEVVPAAADAASRFEAATAVTIDTGTINGEDMETAAIAQIVAARGLPFIAFRAASDGDGDPLGLPGFPAQFFSYYHLAARNAAAVTVAFLERLAADGAAAASGNLD
jgi:nucleoside phosphorylase